jgi:hypothetical protein
MNSKRFVAILIVMMGVRCLGAPLPESWKFDQPVSIGTNGLIKFEVPLETLDHARPGLEDLRLYDAQGVEIPFLVERPVEVPATVQTVRNLQVKLQTGATVAVVETGLTQAMDGVVLESPARDFIKSTLVEGSQDGKTWRMLEEGAPVFRQAFGASQMQLAVPAGKWAWLRVTLDDRRSAPIPITGAKIQPAGPQFAPAQPLDVRVVERENDAGHTRLTLRMPAAPIVLAGLTIETPESLFSRHVTLSRPRMEENEIHETVLAEGTFYRMALEGSPTVSNLTFGRDIVIPVKELTMTIENGDSPPLAITTVRATRRPVYATCLAQAPGSYHLLSGNPACDAPRYDLASLVRDVSGRWVPSRAGALVTNAAYRQTVPLPEVPETGAALDTREWKYRKSIAIMQSGVQQFELDLEVLSKASRDLHDLRLVREGRQIAYLVERPRLSRRFSPVVEKVPDSRRPSLSRWKLTLPQPSLPIIRLQAQTEAPFFKRDVALWEQVPDERGNLNDIQRGTVSWVRSLNQARTPLLMDISGPLATDAVFLEMENGDNPPLAVDRIEMEYAVARLIFKASGEGTVYLYYGNPKAHRPQYDIDLAARQMFAEEKHKVSAGAGEELRGHVFYRFGGAAGWMFWGVLCLVVVGLVVVITRLLPKHLSEE